MEIQIDLFITNHRGLIWRDVVPKIRFKQVNDWIWNVYFETTDKYVIVETDTTLQKNGKSYQVITISPFLEDSEGNDLIDIDVNAYFTDPNYWELNILVHVPATVSNIVTPLKHEYVVSYILDELVLDTSDMIEFE